MIIFNMSNGGVINTDNGIITVIIKSSIIICPYIFSNHYTFCVTQQMRQ